MPSPTCMKDTWCIETWSFKTYYLTRITISKLVTSDSAGIISRIILTKEILFVERWSTSLLKWSSSNPILTLSMSTALGSSSISFSTSPLRFWEPMTKRPFRTSKKNRSSSETILESFPMKPKSLFWNYLIKIQASDPWPKIYSKINLSQNIYTVVKIL